MGITRNSWHKRRATGGARPQPHDKTIRLGSARKTRILDTVYNATNNELVRTKTLVKGTIVSVDALPFRQWYENHYALPLARKKGQKGVVEQDQDLVETLKVDGKLPTKYILRQRKAAIDPNMIEQFHAGKLLARVASSPGQVGRCDGYILEGKELEFYLRKLRAKKTK